MRAPVRGRGGEVGVVRRGGGELPCGGEGRLRVTKGEVGASGYYNVDFLC